MLYRLSILTAALFIASVLQAQSEDFGKWESLFSGKDTTGWVKAKKDQKDAPWKVADGALTNAGSTGMDLSTDKEFENYELEIEFKVPRSGNSGVYLRGQIEVQICDSNGRKTGLGPGDVGGIYGVSAPKKNAEKPVGEWNKYRITHIGNRVTVYLNGDLIQDNVYVDHPTGGAMGVFPPTGKDLSISKGPIMVQGDHSEIWYRNIRIRPLCSGEGWKSMWDGKDLSQLNAGDAKIGDFWEVADHAVTNKTWGEKGHDIWTNGKYGNFLAHYEYRSDPLKEGGNSGFYLRDQWEIQIFGTQDVKEPHSDASLYSIKPPAVAARNDAPDGWNQMDVKVDGMKIWVWQNGKLIHDGVELKTRTDDHGRETRRFSKGPFKLQGDHGKVWFTNLFIKELPDPKLSG